MKYKVDMTRTTIEYLTVEVEADSKDEAENKAHQETESDEFEGGDPKYFNWEIDSVEGPPDGKTQALIDAAEAAGIPVVDVKLDPSKLTTDDFTGLPVVERDQSFENDCELLTTRLKDALRIAMENVGSIYSEEQIIALWREIVDPESDQAPAHNQNVQVPHGKGSVWEEMKMDEVLKD